MKIRNILTYFGFLFAAVTLAVAAYFLNLVIEEKQKSDYLIEANEILDRIHFINASMTRLHISGLNIKNLPAAEAKDTKRKLQKFTEMMPGP